MTKNTICSLALLTANWYINQKDYIENFVPFVATLIQKKKYDRIEITRVCEDFAKEFGLVIPFHPMHTILNRSKKRGLIVKHDGMFSPVYEKIPEFEFSKAANEQLRRHEKVLNEIIDFAARKHNFELSRQSAETAFISWLKNYDLEILFASEEQSLLPDVSSSRKERFVVHSFIKNAYESEPEIFKFIVDAAIGHLMANSLLYKEFDKFIGRLKGINIFIDTKIIFRLLGLEGREREVVYTEFLKSLLKEKANLFVFRHSYDEAIEILEDSYRWVENPLYDPSLASAVTNYFVRNNYTKLDVRRFINKIESVLRENGIEKNQIVDPPAAAAEQNSLFQIDERKLHGILVETYRNSNPYFEEAKKEISIQRDIDSISAIYRLRKGKTPRLLKDVSSVFMTTNNGLAYTARKYELIASSNSSYIPACLTDVFIGTILWLQSPAKISNINEKKLIADCYAALQPDNKLLKRFLSEVERLRAEGKITDSEYYFLRSDSVVMDMLEEKTLGDPEGFTTKIPLEILDEIKSEIRKKEGQKYLEERERHEDTRREFEAIKEISLKRRKSIETRAERVSIVLSKCISCILFAIFIAGAGIQILPEFFKSNPRFETGLIVLYALLGIGSFVLTLNDVRSKVQGWLKSKIIHFFDQF